MSESSEQDLIGLFNLNDNEFVSEKYYFEEEDPEEDLLAELRLDNKLRSAQSSTSSSKKSVSSRKSQSYR